MPEEQIKATPESIPSLKNVQSDSSPERETRPEQLAEKNIQTALEQKSEIVPVTPSPVAPKRSAAPLSLEEKRAAQIDQILSAGLEDIYLHLDTKHQRQFRLAGESAVLQINSLLGEAKVKARKILDVIRKWLSLIPGVNHFFLEQESKIKTDQILRLKP